MSRGNRKKSLEQTLAIDHSVASRVLEDQKDQRAYAFVSLYLSCFRLAQWLTLVYYEELGQSFATFVNDAFALWEENPSIKLVHFKKIVLEGGRVMQQGCIDQLAYVNAQFRQQGQPTMGANQHSLRCIKNLATIPNKESGEPTLERPYARLRPGHRKGVIRMYEMEHADKLRRAGLAVQVE